MSEPARKQLKRLKLLVQALVSVCLIVFVLRRLDLTEVKSLALHPDRLPWLLAALVLFNLSKMAGALRLNVYQRHAAILLSEGENLRLYYAGMFLNLFLPGGIGGDGYKILVLHRRQAVPVRKLLWVTLLDRASGLLILLLLLCLLILLVDLPPGVRWISTLAPFCGISIVLTMAWAHYRLLNMESDRVLQVAACGLAAQLLQLACMAMLLAYVHAPTEHYLAYLAIFLVSSVLTVIPVSFGGLGVREVTAFYGLQLLQLDPAPGVLASSGFFLVTVMSSLPGAFCLRGFSARSPSPG